MKRIVVIGPESTGKSTLCTELAAHYDTVWCPEYARQYLLERGKNYTYEDLNHIARGQLEMDAAWAEEARNGLYFVDTDLYVMKVWYEVVFGHCPTWILKAIARGGCDLYLLCHTDLPWDEDELREYPDPVFRRQLFKMYKDLLLNSGIPWVEINGTDRQRMQKAAAAIEGIFQLK